MQPAEVVGVIGAPSQPKPDYEARLSAIEVRLDKGNARFDLLQEAVDENTEITREVRELLQMGKAGLRFMGHVGTAVVWIGKISAAGVAVWGVVYAFMQGRPPGK